MTEFFLSFASVTLTMGLAAAVLLALAPLFRKRFTAQWRYWVWLVLALRLAVPFHFSGPKLEVNLPLPDLIAGMVVSTSTPVIESSAALAMDETGRAQVWTETAIDEVVVRDPAARPFPVILDPALVLTAVWLFGAGVFLTFQWGRYARLRRMVRRWGRPADEAAYAVLAEAMDRAGVTARVELTVCPMVASPALAGWFRPVILLPEDFPQEALSFALLHELTHLQRYDLWYKALLVWCNALHWFNPAVWLLRAQAEKDVEYACDEQALRGRGEGFRRSYGLAILSAAARSCPAAALTTHFTGNGKRLRARISALLDTTPKRVGRTALTVVVCAALAAGSLVACRPAKALQETYAIQEPTVVQEAQAAQEIQATATTVYVADVVEGLIVENVTTERSRP